MDPIENYPQGHWVVGDKKFINKYEALLYATEKNLLVKYKFFDEVWEKYNKDNLGKISLQEVYKQRAQQLRDKYDYLILYFSGGADSYNVLRSFIDNGIKLDEVCIKWSADTLTANTEVYKPNTQESSAWNYLSEWDYAIKPVLDELAYSNPEIKIEIVDWFKNKDLIGAEETFKLVNHWHDVEVTSLAVWSPSEAKLVDQGKSVGSIYGVDKPQIYFEDDGVAYMIFIDSATTMGTPNPCNIYGTEYFYWAPDFPLITFETAFRAVEAFRTDPLLQGSKFDKDVKTDITVFSNRNREQQKNLRHILYDNWTDNFQAGKPIALNRADKHFWIYQSPELKYFKDSYQDMINLHTKQLRADLYRTGGWPGSTERTSMYKFITTKKFLIS
jgi:hypothetical protein